MVLGVLSFVYSAFRIPVKTEDVVEHVLMFCGCCFCRAFIVDTFSLVTNEVSVSLIGGERIVVSLLFFFCRIRRSFCRLWR